MAMRTPPPTMPPHKRLGMLTFFSTAVINCNCGWRIEVKGSSSDDAERQAEAAWDEHEAEVGRVVT